MTRRGLGGATTLAVLLVLGACTSAAPKQAESAGLAEPVVSEPVEPAGTAVLPDSSAAELASETARTFFDSAPLAVVAAPDTALAGASVAVAMGVPVLVAGEADGAIVSGALESLGTETVLAFGDPDVPDRLKVVTAPEDPAGLGDLLGADLRAREVAPDDAVDAVVGLDPQNPALLGTPEDVEASAQGEVASSGQSGNEPDLPGTERPEPAATSTVVMSTGEPAHAAPAATARAAGASVQIVPSGDPRESGETVHDTAANNPDVTIGLGTSFGDDETLGWRTRAATTGIELPGGGQLALADTTYVALYGSPGTPSLGVLGEQDTAQTIDRIAETAASYRGLTDGAVVPALEIIATVATNSAGPDGDYSNEIPVEQLRPLVEAASEAGQYVILDLQPGRTDFLTQAKRYEELLAMPHVGLALDPEWRLGPDERHLEQIGHVDATEIEDVVTWLADLTREHAIPQKLLVLHAFRPSMLPDLQQARLDRSELAVLIHADGQGTQADKQSTWNALHDHAPHMNSWGWKNFLDEDATVLTPEETMAIEPTPSFISYQ